MTTDDQLGTETERPPEGELPEAPRDTSAIVKALRKNRHEQREQIRQGRKLVEDLRQAVEMRAGHREIEEISQALSKNQSEQE